MPFIVRSNCFGLVRPGATQDDYQDRDISLAPIPSVMCDERDRELGQARASPGQVT